MAYDPNKPADLAPIVSAELRDRFNALKALIDAKPSMDDVNAAINENNAANSNAVECLTTYASDLPTQSEVQSVIYKLNKLIGALARQA